MSSCQKMVPLAFVFLMMQSNFLAFGQLIQTSCVDNGMNYTDNNSEYRANLNTAFSTLVKNLDNSGFANASVGQNPDRVNAIILCRGDLQLDECRSCAQNASRDVLTECPYQKQAGTWEETCLLRYSNVTTLGAGVDSPGPVRMYSPENATSPEKFKANLRTLLDDIRGKAANGGPLRKVAAGNITGPDFQEIYALVQCTPDLSQEDCNACLIAGAQDIPRYFDGKRGARVLGSSCNLRYEIFPFYNETRLQELGPRAPDDVPVLQPGPVSAPSSLLSSPPGKGKRNTTRIAVIVVGSVVACLIIAVFVVVWLRKRIKRKSNAKLENKVDDADISTTDEFLQHTLSTIRAATNNFSDDNKLGQGGFGAVYKGKLSNGREIAVKRLSKNSGQGDLEFKNEVLLLARLQHRNLVKLLGFCLEEMEKLLVYEFVQHASLDLFIFDRIKRTHLDWDIRHKIIMGIARGTLYLHEDSRLRIVHRDLKASNVLLDANMNPKIADFGMARLFRQDETQANTSRIVGTYGYMAPEYAMQGQFSSKSDVYSFGVLVLEIISGQRNNCFRSGEIVEDLLSFAWKNWREGTAAGMVDPFLKSGSGSMSDILRHIHIGLLCVQENAADRPTMASVVLMLNTFSITLSLPSQPAFFMASGYDSEVALMQEYNSRDLESNNSSKSNKVAQSNHSDASITELYPR